MAMLAVGGVGYHTLCNGLIALLFKQKSEISIKTLICRQAIPQLVSIGNITCKTSPRFPF